MLNEDFMKFDKKRQRSDANDENCARIEVAKEPTSIVHRKRIKYQRRNSVVKSMIFASISIVARKSNIETKDTSKEEIFTTDLSCPSSSALVPKDLMYSTPLSYGPPSCSSYRAEEEIQNTFNDKNIEIK